jgi:hypothetical protein
MGASLDRVLAASGVTLTAPPEGQPVPYEAELALAAQMLGDAWLVLASDPDNDGDDDSTEEGDTDNDAGHTGHALFKKMRGKLGDKAAAKMCANADKKSKVAASMVASALTVMGLAAPPGESAEERRQSAKAGNALPDGSYPIPDVKHLHSAAVLAASGHGNVTAAKALIRKRAKELGVDINSLPGFGNSDSDDGKKMAASMISLAMPGAEPPMTSDHSGVMTHGNFHGSHTHPHPVVAAHGHAHFHNGDNHHGHHPGTPRHMGY